MPTKKCRALITSDILFSKLFESQHRMFLFWETIAFLSGFGCRCYFLKYPSRGRHILQMCRNSNCWDDAGVSVTETSHSRSRVICCGHHSVRGFPWTSIFDWHRNSTTSSFLFFFLREGCNFLFLFKLFKLLNYRIF